MRTYLLIAVFMVVFVPLAFAQSIYVLYTDFDSLEGPQSIELVKVGGVSYVLVGSAGSNAIQVMNVEDPKIPVPSGSITVSGNPTEIETATISGDTFALVILDGNTLQVIRITDMQMPHSVATFNGGTSADWQDIETFTVQHNTYAMISDLAGNSIIVLNVTDPYSPHITGTIQDGGNGFEALAGPRDIEIINDHYALVASEADSAIQIIDMTNPRFPVSTATILDGSGGFDAMGGVADIATVMISGHTYALATGVTENAVQIINVTDLQSPTSLGSIRDGEEYSLNEPQDVIVTKRDGRFYAVVASEPSRSIQIIDITDPASPAPTSTLYDGGDYALMGIQDMVMVSSCLYVTNYVENTVQIIHIKTPEFPVPTRQVVDENTFLEDLAISEVPTRYDLETIQSRTVAVVNDAVIEYAANGTQFLDENTPEGPVLSHMPYVFVLDAKTGVVLSHGADPAMVGQKGAVLTGAAIPYGEIISDMEMEGGVWVSHLATNENARSLQLKHSWLFLYDGYVFGAGYYIQDAMVQSRVDEAVGMYKTDGESAFDMITPEESKGEGEPYVVVLDSETARIVAHGAQPDTVGELSHILTQNSITHRQILAELERVGGVWVLDVSIESSQTTRVWLFMHDGYIFLSQYGVADPRVQSVILVYET